MSSIITNTSAMVALQTLRSTNTSLARTQNEISTGKSIATAKDNAAVWAISKVMESDVKGFQEISSSLALGKSTLDVARKATESITDMLQQIKGKIVAAQEENVDRAKIQADIDQMRNQIYSIANAAQFSGLNLVKGTEQVSVLASMDRDGSGNVTASHINIDRQNMTVDSGVWGTGTSASGAITASPATLDNTNNSQTITLDDSTTTGNFTGVAGTITVGGRTITVTAGDLDAGVATQADAAAALAQIVNDAEIEDIVATVDGSNNLVITATGSKVFEDVALEHNLTGFAPAYAADTTGTLEIAQKASNLSLSGVTNAGDGYRVTIAGLNYNYIASAGETMEDVARGLKIAIDNAPPEGVSTRVEKVGGAWVLKVDGGTPATAHSLAVATSSDGEATGGLFGLDGISVLTTDKATNALDNVEGLIKSAIDAAAAFGSAQKRMDIQSNFISDLTDALRTGISSMVDANMEEASARLQALQVQQQLGVQALSIANQSPQTILALFR